MKNITNYLLHDLVPFIRYSVKAPKNRKIILFSLEGMLITVVNNLIANNNNLFATRLGANDYELSLVITLPQLIGMLVLIPGGILTDRMPNKRNMVIIALTSVAAFYTAIGFVPLLGLHRLQAFLLLLAISTGPMTIYNVSWQAYFSDVVEPDTRNTILTARTGLTFLVGIIISLGSGALLSAAKTINDKLWVHQIYFWTAVILLMVQAFVLKKIQDNKKHISSRIGIRDLKAALSELRSNKRFLGFIGVAIFFYVTWHMDWTLYFLGQVNYIGLNEAWLSYVSIGGAVVQFLTVGFWSRINVKWGVRFGMIFGNLGLSLFPICMIISTSIPSEYGKVVFLILNTLCNFAMATTTLNILQCLLQVIPDKNKTLNISIYTVLVTLSNAVMPLVGVSVYTALGADLQAMHMVFWIIFALRIVATGLWITRYIMLRNEPK